MKLNKNLIGVFVLVLILALSFTSAYYRSQVNYAQYGNPVSGLIGTGISQTQCLAGQDFILQVAPLGCEPLVVRSDLLEEQNVQVFCPISATKLNPLIDVEAINTISLTGSYPADVVTVGFHPARAAINPNQNQLTEPILFDNVGYATITLRQQPNESAIPDVIEGNLTARITYDIKNAFGVGRNTFYLPVLTDSDWERDYTRYSFWDGRGYLRAEGVSPDEAIISIYSGQSIPGILGGSSNQKTVYSTASINVGETSNPISIPGFDMCLATMELKLEGVINPDTRAKLRVNGESVEVVQGEKFLENKCQLSGIQNNGFNQEIRINCREDSTSITSGGSRTLRIIPEIVLDISGNQISANVGDFLYTEGSESIYLGYAATEGNTNKKDNLYVQLVSVPGATQANKPRLTQDEIGWVKTIAEGARSQTTQGEETFATYVEEFGQKIIGSVANSFKWIVDGNNYEEIVYGRNPVSFKGKEIQILGFSGAQDEELSLEVQGNFDNARNDYEEILVSYPDEENPENPGVKLGEDSLWNLILLANNLNQKQTMLEYCQEFRENYPNSKKVLSVCVDELGISNKEISSTEVVINGNVERITFEGVYEPSFQDYGAEGIIRYSDGSLAPFSLRKNKPFYLNPGESNDYIELIDLDESSAEIRTNVKSASALERTGRQLGANPSMDLNSPISLGDDYVLTLTKVNLKKVAKVSVVPNVNYAGTEAQFSFSIPVEKRNIQFSPERTQEILDGVQSSIESIETITDSLGTIVEAGKTACLATEAVLTIKNYVQNVGGEGIARSEVMQGSGGWYERCADLVSQGAFSSQDNCLFENSDKIEAEIESIHKFKVEQEEELALIRSKYETQDQVFSTKTVDESKVVEEYSAGARTDLSSFGSSFKDPEGKGEDIDLTSLNSVLNEKGWAENNFEVEQLNDVKLYSEILSDSSSSAEMRETASKRLYQTLFDIQENSEQFRQLKSASEEYGFNEVAFVSSRSLTENVLTNPDTFGQINSKNSFSLPGGSSIDDNDFVVETIDRADGKKYLVVLNDNFVPKQTYEILGKSLSVVNQNSTNPLNLGFKKYDSSSYQNKYKNPELRYYETEPYQGEPAIVPFDTDNGWYVSAKQSLPVFGGIRGYDESGVVRSFYLCNVGQNGLEENVGGDDICQLINTNTGQTYTQFPGISDSGKVLSLVREASNAIEAAQRIPERNRNGFVNLLGNRIQIGDPAVDVPELQCYNFMSPQECKILFNVCDPVVCPSSRCDFGGSYPVRDVVQSGVIGSVALCLPNAQEGIAVPVCLTGIHAGLDGFNSVQKSYRDCLQESLDTGSTVGICDEIQSVYMCEFFYRQAVPLASVGIPKLTELIVRGVGGHGGGEYLGVSDAWSKASDSFEYFTQYYAQNANQAFKARSVEEAGQNLICQQFISVSYPGGDLLDTLTRPDSPAQYHGRFDEIPFTTATNPPTSQYKVFYHIYAGNDRGTYYRVYLRGDTSSSFYQDNIFNVDVASGYIAAGDYATETRDLTAPSGYKELCINVNGQEECGFKEVSTSFAVDYVNDLYIQEQTSARDINTEAECVSGTISAYSLLNPNLQSSAEDLISPELYSQGISRVCSSQNPGLGTDAKADIEGSRWVRVGSCSENLGCWLDTQNVKDVVQFSNIEDQILNDTAQEYLRALQNENGYLSETEYESSIEGIKTSSGTYQEKIMLINEIVEKVFFNNQKSYLIYLRAGYHSLISEESYAKYVENKIKSEIEISKEDFSCDPDTETCLDSDRILIVQHDSNVLTTLNNVLYSFPRLNVNLLYFRYSEPWEWSPDLTTWTPVPQTEISSGEYEGDSPTQSSFNLIESLESKNLESGVEILYDNGAFEYPTYFDLTSFSDEELLTMKDAKTCGDCGADSGFFTFGAGNICDKNECLAIGDLIDKNCIPELELIGNTGSPSWSCNEEINFNNEVISKLRAALDEIKDLDGKYSENKAFVDYWYGQGLFTEEEYDEIDGGLFGFDEEDMRYVEELLQKKLSNSELDFSFDGSDFEDFGGETCPIVEESKDVSGSASNKVVEEMKKWIGVRTPSEASGSCYDSVEYIYRKAGVDMNCIYSEEIGKEFVVGGNTIQTSEHKGSTPYWVYPNGCSSVGLNENQKLNRLFPGTLISYSYAVGKPHNAIFVNWSNEPNREAWIFDWIPGRTYGYRIEDLSDNSHPVYVIWRPVDSGSSSSNTGFENYELVDFESPNFEEKVGSSSSTSQSSSISSTSNTQTTLSIDVDSTPESGFLCSGNYGANTKFLLEWDSFEGGFYLTSYEKVLGSSANLNLVKTIFSFGSLIAKNYGVVGDGAADFVRENGVGTTKTTYYSNSIESYDKDGNLVGKISSPSWTSQQSNEAKAKLSSADEFYQKVIQKCFFDDFEPVVWEDFEGLEFDGDKISSTDSTYSGFAFSRKDLLGDGGVSFKVPSELPESIGIGLISSRNGFIYEDFYHWSLSKTYVVHRKGPDQFSSAQSLGGDFVDFGDTISVERIGNEIFYKVNGKTISKTQLSEGEEGPLSILVTLLGEIDSPEVNVFGELGK